jgi:hypothetical protein
VLCWGAEPGASLTGEVKLAAEEIRRLLGEAARPTICFDRGGYSPKLFAEFHPAAMRLSPECKRLHDAMRMATYSATTTLCRLLAPHYSRAEDEGRTLLLEALRAPADLEVIGDELHVLINPPVSPPPQGDRGAL